MADIPASAYVQDGLIVQYDGFAALTQDGKLANLGSSGSDFDLSPVTKEKDYVANGWIHMETGWWMSAALGTAVKGTGYTVECCGKQSGAGASDAGYYFMVGTSVKDGSNTGSEGIAISLGTAGVNAKGMNIGGLTATWNGSSYTPNGTVNGSVLATRSGTVDASATKMIAYYENGKFVSSAARAGTSDPGIKRVNLGDLRAKRGCYWKGDIGSVRIYNRVLTADEITINANIDKVRFENADPTTLTWPKEVRLNTDVGLLEYVMAIRSSGGGSVTANGQSVSEEYFLSGASVELVATPDSGMKFGWWSGDVPTAKAKDATVTVTTVGRVMSVTAHFVDENAAIWFVPGDFDSLDAALRDERVKDGDIIKIMRGSYVSTQTEANTWMAVVEKGVTIVGEDDPGTVSLDCNGAGGIKLANPEARLSGFTLVNFATTVVAQGLYSAGASISNVVVRGRTGKPTNLGTTQIFLGEGTVFEDSTIDDVDNFYSGWKYDTTIIIEGATVRRSYIHKIQNAKSTIVVRNKSAVRSLIEDCVIDTVQSYTAHSVSLTSSDMRRCVVRGTFTNSGSLALGLNDAHVVDTVVSNCTYDTSVKPDQPVIGILGNSSLTNCLVCLNKACNGPMIRVSDKKTGTLVNCTIADNKVTSAERGGFDGSGTLVAVNTIFKNNVGTTGDITMAEDRDPAKTQLSHCLYTGCTALPSAPDADGNFDADPAFTDAGRDYTLQKVSPCVDTGADVEGLDHDLNGDARPLSGTGGVALYDIGCYEREEMAEHLVCGLTIVGTGGAAPCDIPLIATISGTRSEGVKIEWRLILVKGETEVTNAVVTTDRTYTFGSCDAGVYRAEIRVWNDFGDEMIAQARDGDGNLQSFAVRPGTTYVSADGSNQPPYATPETAAHDLRAAYESAEEKVVVLPGAYKFSHTTDSATVDGTTLDCILSVQRGVTVESSEGPEKTVIDCDGLGGVILNHADAKLLGFTFTNFVANAGSGHLLFVNKGLASNVIARGGTTMAVASRDALNVDWQGRVEDTVVTNLNSTQGYAVNTAGGRFRNLKLVGCAGKATVYTSVPNNGQHTRFVECTFEDNTGITREFLRLRNSDLKSPVVRRNSLTSGNLINTYGSTYIDGIVRDNTTSAAALVGNWTESWNAACSRFTNCLFVANSTKSGVFHTENIVNFSLQYVNCTIADNVATDGTVCGIAGTGHTDVGEGVNDIKNCIVWGNTADGQPADVNVLNVLRTKTSVNNSCFAEAAEAPDKGNTAADPEFLTSSPYHFNPESPCCNTGANLGWEKGGKDLDGNPRLFRRRVDMGCYECQIGPGLRILVR